jgi:dephospho-CoA kinase
MLQQTSAYIIKEAALLFESGANKYLDHIIGVSAPRELRIKRVMERDHTTHDEIFQRMNRQMNEDAKMKLCDSIIINDDQHMVIPQVMELHKKFMAISKR